jgi:TetR/AcrR family transcriptional regulator, cholesterol catabolism regulator
MSRGETGARSREAILREAVGLFSRKGYPGTSMRDIADAVGLLPGSLYAHIDDKEGLLVEIVETGIDKFLAAAESVEGEGEPADRRIRGLIEAHIGVIAENALQTSVVFHQWKHLSPVRRAVVVSKRNRYEDLFTSTVEDGIASGVFSEALDPRIAVLSILGILNWVPEWFSANGPDTPEDVSERLADVVLMGLAARHG